MKPGIARLIAPLVLVGWFLWPFSTGITAAAIALAVVKAYALFFVATFIAEQVTQLASALRTWHVALVFGFAAILSFGVGIGLEVTGLMEPGTTVAGLVSAALRDGFWCAAAAALARVLDPSASHSRSP